jgi:predicted transcriptional regulator
MKTAVSLPDKLFKDADRLARQLKKSRSKLYAEAITEYVARHDPDDNSITDAINTALAQGPLETPEEIRWREAHARDVLERLGKWEGKPRERKSPSRRAMSSGSSFRRRGGRTLGTSGRSSSRAVRSTAARSPRWWWFPVPPVCRVPGFPGTCFFRSRRPASGTIRWRSPVWS